jgi:hypothetical protein
MNREIIPLEEKYVSEDQEYSLDTSRMKKKPKKPLTKTDGYILET